MGETQPPEHLVPGEGVPAKVLDRIVGHIAPRKLIQILQTGGRRKIIGCIGKCIIIVVVVVVVIIIIYTTTNSDLSKGRRRRRIIRTGTNNNRKITMYYYYYYILLL